MSSHMVFRVTVEERTQGWWVAVDAGPTGLAEAWGPTLTSVLDCGGVFMREMVRPDPLEQAFGLPSAPDGPVQG